MCSATSIALLCIFTVSSAAASQQFSRNVDAQYARLDYQFVDVEGTPQPLQVRLNRNSLMRTPTVFRPLSQHRLQREIVRHQQQFAREQGWLTAQVSVRHGELEYHFLGRGDHRAALRTWKNAEHDAYLRVLEQHYYQHLRMPGGQSGYAPDHPRIARESVESVAPLAAKLKAISRTHYDQPSPRQTLAFVAHFIQQIPYSELDDRFTSPGAGFLTPGRVLFENRGDCDSKVTLLAALMLQLHPELEQRIVYVPGHALFALELDPEDDDIYLNDRVDDDTMTFVVVDPTGPAQLGVGEAASRDQSHLRSGAVTMLPVH